MTTTPAPSVFKTKPTTVLVSLGKFDRDTRTNTPIMRLVREGIPLADFKPLTNADYSPRGGTPLRDAAAAFIAHLDAVQANADRAVVVGLLADESGSMGGNEQSVINGINEFVGGMADVDSVDGAAAGKVLCVIVTDGNENSSREVSREQLAAMIAEREKRGWTFIYLGANQDAWATADTTGLSGGATGQSVNYTASPKGVASALRSVTCDAGAFLADNAAYNTMRSTTPKRTVGEDGDESAAVIHEAVSQAAQSVPASATFPPQTTPPTFDVEDALRKARGK